MSAPAGSAAAIAAPTAARTSFTPDVKGSYTVMLTVTDGLNAATATASSAVGSGKATLSAGPNQNADAGDLVPMSPTLVANPDGHALSFSWEVVSTAPGSVATLRPANSFAPTLSDLTTPGGYTLRLHATDAYGNVADPSETTVNVKDPQAWVRPTSPVLSASGTGFDCGGVESPSVIRDPSGASFVMFYSGHTCGADSPSSTPWSIGRATGADEVTWTRAGAALPHGLGEAHPTLLVDGAKLKLWFARRESRNCGGGGHAYFWRIAYSETTDLTGASGWSAPQLALGRGDPGNPDWDSGDVLAPFVIKVGGLYRMYYSGDTLVGGGGFGGCGGGNREDGVGDYQIGLATSLDGLNWQKLPPGAGTGTNPVVAGNGTTLQVGGAAGLLDNFQLKLWMAPFPFGAAGGQFQIAYAASATPADWPQAALLPLALDGGAGWDAGYVNNPTLDKSLSLAPSSQIPLYKMWYAGSITPGISQNSLQNASASIGYARRGELQ